MYLTRRMKPTGIQTDGGGRALVHWDHRPTRGYDDRDRNHSLDLEVDAAGYAPGRVTALKPRKGWLAWFPAKQQTRAVTWEWPSAAPVKIGSHTDLGKLLDSVGYEAGPFHLLIQGDIAPDAEGDMVPAPPRSGVEDITEQSLQGVDITENEYELPP